jgi:steroid 5-alpha reductase family enzyme
MTHLIQYELLVIFLFMSGWFGIAIWTKRNDVADIVWGLGFIVAVVAALVFKNPEASRVFLVSTLVFVWGGRLAVRIFLRNVKKSEDSRYKAWRDEWGDNFLWRTFFQVFMLQGVLILIIATPVLFIVTSDNPPLSSLDYLGLLLWLVGFFFESVGDFQLDQFKNNPANRGKVMQSGLWRYSRHPNYFGEVVMWWGIFCLALSIENGWMTILGPATITFLILKVSGIPLAEKRSLKKPDFQAYMKRTSVFFPLPPRKDK